MYTINKYFYDCVFICIAFSLIYNNLEMDKYNIAVLVDAKQEYTHQLIQLLYQHIYVGIKSIYDAARDYCETAGDKHVLRKFQQLLSDVPKWNTDRIENEYSRIKALTECDWMDDLITAVFVSHTKVLTAIQLKNKTKKSIELNVPTGEHFIHKCYTEVARAFWKRPYLLNHQLSNIDLQRNLADSEQLIKDSIQETVRRMLPVRHILKEYLGNDFNEEQLDTEEDITSQLSVASKNNLRKLVQQEIEQTLSKGGNSSNEQNSFAEEVSAVVPAVESSTILTESNETNNQESDIAVETKNDHSSISEESSVESNVNPSQQIETSSSSNEDSTLNLDDDVKEIHLDKVKESTETKTDNFVISKEGGAEEEKKVSELIEEYTVHEKSQHTDTPSISLEVQKEHADHPEDMDSAKDFEKKLIEHIERESTKSTKTMEESSSRSSAAEYDMYSMGSSKSTASAKKSVAIPVAKEKKPVFSFFEDACNY
jgi:hypothetical protein